MTVMKKEVYNTHRSLETGSVPSHTKGPHGEVSRSVSRQREERENVGESLYYGFYRKEQVKVGKQAWDGLVE